MSEKLCFYMLTYFRKKSEEADFTPSGVIVNEAGTDRFDYDIDDKATEELVTHYVIMIKQGLLSSLVDDPRMRAIATLRSNLADRPYSAYDACTQFGEICEASGNPVDVMEQKYKEFVGQQDT